MIHALGEADETERVFGRHGIGADLRDERDVFARGQARDQIVGLENEADPAIAKTRQFQRRKRRQISAIEPDFPRRRRIQPAQQMQQRALARARRAAHGQKVAAGDCQVNLPQHVKRSLADEIRFSDGAGVQERTLRPGPRRLVQPLVACPTGLIHTAAPPPV